MRRGISVLLVVGILAFAALPLVLAPEPSGVGVLYVYEDAGYGTLKTMDAQGRFSVLPGETIYIHLDNLKDLMNSWTGVELRFGTPDGSIPIGTFTKQMGDSLPNGVHTASDPYVGDGSQVIDWVVGDADGDDVADYFWPESNTIVLQYKYVAAVGADVPGNWFVAAGPITTRGHLHIVPEISLGVVGVSVVALAAFAVFAARRRR